MSHLVSILLVLSGLINLAPVVGALGQDRLEKLYGIPFIESNLLILMRHRAILLAIVGFLLILSAAIPSLQVTSISAGFISMISYIVIARLQGRNNSNIQNVIRMDIIAIAFLIVASIVKVALL